MRVAILGFPLLLASCAAPVPGLERESHAVELSGAATGPARHCVMLSPIESLRVSNSDPHTLLYGNGTLIFANHLGHCGLRRDDILVTEPTGSELCSGDLVRSIDRNTRIPGPTCVLGEFLPYRR